MCHHVKTYIFLFTYNISCYKLHKLYILSKVIKLLIPCVIFKRYLLII